MVIIVQQESLRERPRIHKLTKVLEGLGLPFEVWKFRGEHSEQSEAPFIRNLMTWRRRKFSPALRYLAWMSRVLVTAWSHRRNRHFFAVGFDSALPVALLPSGNRGFVFDNLDNISLSYRWPGWFQPVVRLLELWVARRSRLHVVPSRQRWQGTPKNLRIVTNTPSAAVLKDAKGIASSRGYRPGAKMSLYLNGWLSPTRGIRTLLDAIPILEQAGVPVRVIVAGRVACDDAERLVRLSCVENLGMLTNEEALATYYRCHVAYTYYDPSVTINRLAESQKWTDCWATGTPFICNSEVETIVPYVRATACFTAAYADPVALAELIRVLASEPARLETARVGISGMAFKYWDDEMRKVIEDWLPATERS